MTDASVREESPGSRLPAVPSRDRRSVFCLAFILAGALGWLIPVILFQGVPTGVKSKSLVIKGAAGTPLVMHMYLPAAAEVRPAALILHGCRANWKVYDDYGRALAAAGFVVGMPDLHGHGGSAGQHGNWEELLQDARAALAVLQAEAKVGDERTVVLGHSMGAGVAGALAFRRPKLAGVVAIGGGCPSRPARFPTNLLLTTGRNDWLMPPDAAREAGRLFTGKDLVVGKLYGSFDDRSAIKIYISEVGHLGESSDPGTIREAVAWCRQSSGNDDLPAAEWRAPPLWIMGFQMASGVLLIIATGALLCSTRPETRKPAWKHSALCVLGLFAIFFLLLRTTVSARFYDLGPHGLRATQYLIVAGVILPVLVGHLFCAELLPRVARFSRGLVLDLSLMTVTLTAVLGLSAVFWGGLFPFWPLIATCLLVGLVLFSVMLAVVRVHPYVRLPLAALNLCWLLVATIPGY
jgi:dienelactone hydrolase